MFSMQYKLYMYPISIIACNNSTWPDANTESQFLSYNFKPNLNLFRIYMPKMTKLNI